MGTERSDPPPKRGKFLRFGSWMCDQVKTGLKSLTFLLASIHLFTATTEDPLRSFKAKSASLITSIVAIVGVWWCWKSREKLSCVFFLSTRSRVFSLKLCFDFVLSKLDDDEHYCTVLYVPYCAQYGVLFGRWNNSHVGSWMMLSILHPWRSRSSRSENLLPNVQRTFGHLHCTNLSISFDFSIHATAGVFRVLIVETSKRNNEKYETSYEASLSMKWLLLWFPQLYVVS